MHIVQSGAKAYQKKQIPTCIPPSLTCRAFAPKIVAHQGLVLFVDSKSMDRKCLIARP